MGTAVFGLLTLAGWTIWSNQPSLLAYPSNTETPATVQVIVNTISTMTATETITKEPAPATMTPIPTTARTETPTNTATSMPTMTLAETAVPPTPTQPVTPSPLTAAEATPAAPTITPTSWPTTSPTLLRKPPADVDLSRSHIWFSRPVDGNNIPSAPYRFGMTYHQRLSPHRGVDIANETGTPVLAVGPGIVLYAGADIETLFGPKPDFYGQVVVVKMDWTWEGRIIYTLYGHLDTIAIESGQPVNPGDILGEVGSTGVSLGPHLHFEVRQDDPYDYGSVRNPELWYWPFNGRGVVAGRVIDASGNFMPGTRVNLDCSDGTPRHVETYWDQYTPPDDILMENFAISDLPAGSCRVSADLFGQVVEQFVDVQSGELSMVVLQAEQ